MGCFKMTLHHKENAIIGRFNSRIAMSRKSRFPCDSSGAFTHTLRRYGTSQRNEVSNSPNIWFFVWFGRRLLHCYRIMICSISKLYWTNVEFIYESGLIVHWFSSFNFIITLSSKCDHSVIKMIQEFISSFFFFCSYKSDEVRVGMEAPHRNQIPSMNNKF